MPALAQILQQLREASKSAYAEKERTKELWRKFSAEVRDHRIRKGMILKELAEKTGIGQGTLFYLEHNEREWTLERASLVVKALK